MNLIELKEKIAPYYRKIFPMSLEIFLKYHLPISKRVMKDNTQKVYIFIAAEYGNLGDIAITEAQKKFIEMTLVNAEVILISVFEKLSFYREISNNIRDNDIITIIGGGNTGDLYPFIELRRQLIVKIFPNNKIIMFPQTVEYSEHSKILSSAKEIFNKHERIYMFAREQNSYNFIQKNFKNVNTFLAPDIVLSASNDTLRQSFNKVSNRNGILLVLRSDKEKSISSSVLDKIKISTARSLEKVSITDTVIGSNRQPYEKLKSELEAKLSEFSNSKLVVTDRLHGMIFCFVTKTPCIFLDNTNKKVSGVYEWISSTNFIEPIEIEELDAQIQRLLLINDEDKISTFDLSEKFLSLKGVMVGDNDE